MDLYQAIQNYLQDKQMNSIKQALDRADTKDIYALLGELDPQDRVVIFRLLQKDIALEIFERLSVEMQEELVTAFAQDEVNALFSEMDPDDRVRLMDELPAKVAKRLLYSLSKKERKKTAELMGYLPQTAGRIMIPEYIRLRRDEKVSKALEKIRRMTEEKETMYTLYVTDDQRRLIGDVSLQKLVISDPEQKIDQIMNPNPVWVNTTTDQEEVARMLQQQDLLAVPVVDNEKRLVGSVTVDDAMDVLDQETTEDIFNKAGLTGIGQQEAVRSNVLVSGSVLRTWGIRLPFLLITLVGGLLAGLVIERFEQALEAITALAIFIPVVMDMGGNVGTQSSTIFARALVLGQINLRRFLRHWVREIGIGLGMGVLLGILAGLVAALWQGIPNLGLAVGTALALTVTLATTLGFLIPYILFKLGFDQAAGSDPIITTIKDITGLFIYFFLVSQFLGYML